MSAAAQQTTAQRSAEPSMEEILASIRRIIAEDQKALEAKSDPQHGAADAAHVPAADDGDDVGDTLDLASIAPPLAPVAEAPAAPAPQAEPAVIDPPRPVAIAPDFMPDAPQPVREPAAMQPPPPPAARPAPAVAAMADALQTPLISAATEFAATSAFQSLTNTVFAQQSKTMDELVSEMLRPMLTVWLDEHLPALVERLVRAEIERVARGGR